MHCEIGLFLGKPDEWRKIDHAVLSYESGQIKITCGEGQIKIYLTDEAIEYLRHKLCK